MRTHPADAAAATVEAEVSVAWSRPRETETLTEEAFHAARRTTVGASDPGDGRAIYRARRKS